MEGLTPGTCRTVSFEGREAAVFNVEGRYYAVGDRCPHRGGPLSRGRVEKEASGAVAVRCPIHGWLFDLSTGKCLNQPQAEVCAYSVTCESGRIVLKPPP